MTKKKTPEELKQARLEALKRRNKAPVDLGEDPVLATLKKIGAVENLSELKVAPSKMKPEDRVAELLAELEDVNAERDALAARVIELEKQVAEFQPCTRSHGEGVADLRKFISDCLKTGTFNSTVATELLK